MTEPASDKTGISPVSYLEILLPALRRLDQLLAAGVKAAEAAYGPKAAADPYRGLYVSTEDVQRLLAREPGTPLLASDPGVQPVPAQNDCPLTWLKTQFSLSDFDMDTVVMALAPEIDVRYERLYAYLQDDVTRRRPSVDLALNLLCGTRERRWTERARFAADAPLIRHRLIHLIPDPGQTQPSLLAHFLKLDEAAVRVLMGQPSLDSRIAAFSQLVQPDASVAGPKDTLGLPAATRQALETLSDEWAQGQSAKQPTGLRLYFQGPAGSGQRNAAESIAVTLKRKLLIVDLARFAASGLDAQAIDTLSALLFREAQLLGAVLYLEHLDILRTDDRAVLLEALLARVAAAPGVVILAGTHAWPPASPARDVIAVPFAIQDFDGRRQYWSTRLNSANIPASKDDLDTLAGGFRFTSEQIDGALAGAQSEARLRGASTSGGETPGVADLFATARTQSTGNLGSLARKIDPLYTWPDIVLPADQVTQLHEICSQARNRNVVFGRWGFDRKISYGKGLNVLFSGPPGTGKTMAAEIIANDLHLGLYKIDLSQVVSKYIGETEKNLSRIFQEARATNAIIFFDEADALFGKRSEVRDAHDRYANIEIAYLLQKMEEYEGISILATNLRQNLDPAFTRRLSFSIDFPFPDESSRLLIWKSIWPVETPVASDLDLSFVATQYKLSGGSVKNIAVAASFMAAEEETPVSTVHLLRAVRREFQKMGKSMSKTEFGPYWDRLEIPV